MLWGGGEPLIVNVNIDDPQNPTIDHTFQEIKEAYINGVEVVAKYPYTGGPGGTVYALAPICAVSVTDDEVVEFRFQGLDTSNPGLIATAVCIGDGWVTYSNKNLS